MSIILLALASVGAPVHDPVFQCSRRNETFTVAAKDGHLVYRHATNGRVDATIPAVTRSVDDPWDVQVSFSGNGWTYVVYQATFRTGDDNRNTDFADGVLVRRGGRTVTKRECDETRPVVNRLGSDARARQLPTSPIVRTGSTTRH